ncbi:MAG: transcriptional regulator [Hydrocarboniphaga sp.]|uniref:FCD domain-containing protein n=1 Tax=Hydrocarboniphaga sp. TaxID=2033016 RepID=UPI00260C2F3D|nr:FCD domain-containing protein [Hydrocarboniphaga sp.]MDB5969892.1 transcriptional regulator [Hydrocarboniphaga sp.]
MVLSSRGATLKQVARVCGPLTIEAVRQLAEHPDPALRTRLAAFVTEHEGFEALPGYRQRGRVIADFERLLAQSCGNPALELFVEAILAITRDAKYTEFQISHEQAAAIARCHRQIAEHVARGEADIAVVVAGRYAAMIVEWLPDLAAEGWLG